MRKIAVIIALLGTPSLADITDGDRTIDCYCTDTDGARVDLGLETCLRVDGRMFMASCQMSLNVPIWRDTGRSCVTGSLQPPSPADAASPS